MAAFDFKTATPGSASASALIFGAESQAAATPSIYNTTGSGTVVLSTSPTLVTPTIGVATATSVNKVTITAPATSATLTIANGKTLTASNTLTFTGTDSSSVAFGAGGTVLYNGGALGTPSSGTLTNCSGLPISGIASLGTGVGTALGNAVNGSGGLITFATFAPASGKTLTVNNSITLAGTDSTTMTFPSTSATIARTDAGNTFTGNQVISSGSFGLSGNITTTAWTTSGVRYKNVAATLTDTSSSGTVATAYTDVFGGNTIAASNSTTFTDYFTHYISEPTAGSNVTFTNKWAFGCTGNAKLTGNLVAGGQVYTPTQTLTDAATITWDTNSSAVATVTITSTGRTLTPSNLKAGGTYVLFVVQGSGGSKTITTWTNFKWASGTTPTLSTSAGAVDIITGVSDGTYIYATFQTGFA